MDGEELSGRRNAEALMLARVDGSDATAALCSIIGREQGADGIPEDFRAETLHRLKALVLVLGVIHILPLGTEIFELLGGGRNGFATSVAVVAHAAALAVAVAFMALLLACRMPLGRAFDLALVFQVVTSFAFACTERAHRPGFLSVVALVILVFPLFVPRGPRKTLVAALISATAVPVAYILTGAPDEATPDIAIPVVLNFVVAGVAVVPATVVAKLSRALDSARRLGSYELVRRIGSGGMGEVWRARHRMLRRPAAVKLIKPIALDETAAARARLRFEREAQVIAELESEHTVRIFDFGATRDGRLFYVMELLSGMDLENIVSRWGPLPPERVVYLMIQACEALADAHHHGVIHRDVKPANIFVTRTRTTADFVKVLDFGLATTRRADAASNLTAENAIVGSPAFLAPEAVLEGSEVDPRTDVYSLGSVMFFLLTGEPPFGGKNAVEMAIAHVKETPRRPSDVVGAALPGWFDDLVVQCLSKSRDERPENMEVLRHALTSGALSRVWTEERARAWWTAHAGRRAVEGKEDAVGL